MVAERDEKIKAFFRALTKAFFAGKISKANNMLNKRKKDEKNISA